MVNKMKHPKHIQEIIDKPSILPQVKKEIKECIQSCDKIMKDAHEILRRMLLH